MEENPKQSLLDPLLEDVRARPAHERVATGAYDESEHRLDPVVEDTMPDSELEDWTEDEEKIEVPIPEYIGGFPMKYIKDGLASAVQRAMDYLRGDVDDETTEHTEETEHGSIEEDVAHGR